MAFSLNKFTRDINALIKNDIKITHALFSELGREHKLKFREISALKEGKFKNLFRTKKEIKEKEKKTAAKNEKPKFKKQPASKLQEQRQVASEVIARVDLSGRGNRTRKPRVEYKEIAGYGVVENTPDSFVWIASPEEIASDIDLHEVAY